MRLKIIDETKSPFLFNSSHLFALIRTTPSVKTWLAIIQALGPRLTDPKARHNDFIALFRYAEDRDTVESVLKYRAEVVQSALYKPIDLKVGVAKGKKNLGGGSAENIFNFKAGLMPRNRAGSPRTSVASVNSVSVPQSPGKPTKAVAAVYAANATAKTEKYDNGRGELVWRESFGARAGGRVKDAIQAHAKPPPPPPPPLKPRTTKTTKISGPSNIPPPVSIVPAPPPPKTRPVSTVPNYSKPITTPPPPPHPVPASLLSAGALPPGKLPPATGPPSSMSTGPCAALWCLTPSFAGAMLVPT